MNPGAVSYTHLDVYKRQIVHIVAQAKNKGMLPAEWVELNFSTLEGDRLAYDAQIGPSDIPAFGSETFSVSILTQNSGARSAWLSYYLMGRESVAE